ncbi:MAG: SPOR domain-containing protein [Pseudomonadota bacterium]
MLRFLVLVLLLGNAIYFSWSRGAFAGLGFAPVQQSEPQRLAQQIRPDAVRVLATDDARRLEATPAPAREAECLQAGLFDETQASAVKLALEPWPAGSWSMETATEPGRWIVYMGKYATDEFAARKRAELRNRGISFEPLGNPALEPGLSLGGHATQVAAQQQLEVLAQRGVRTARVVQERPEASGQLLRLAAVDDNLRPRLDDLKTVLGTRTLRPCR